MYQPNSDEAAAEYPPPSMECGDDVPYLCVCPTAPPGYQPPIFDDVHDPAPPTHNVGRIRIVKLIVHEGTGLKDMDTFTKMDPYVVVTHGEYKGQTSVHNGGGRSPVWDHHCSFRFEPNALLEFEVWDKDVCCSMTDDIVGKVAIDIAQMAREGQRFVKDDFKVKNGEEVRGTIKLTIEMQE